MATHACLLSEEGTGRAVWVTVTGVQDWGGREGGREGRKEGRGREEEEGRIHVLRT